MRLIKKVINRLYNYTLRGDKINWYRSLIFNLAFFSIKDALKFPILIYGKCKFGSLMGTITVKEPLCKGMLKIGISDPLRSLDSVSFISIPLSGNLIIEHNVTLRCGIRMEVGGELILENNVYIGDNVTLTAYNSVTIKASTRIAHDCHIFDYDFHYLVNTKTGAVRDNKAAILIGENCWIGAYAFIKKGTKLPKGTILAGPFPMTSKDYTDMIPEYSIIAGSPAKLIAENMRRVNNLEVEKKLSLHFRKSIEDYYLPLDKLDIYCLPQ